MQLEPLSASGTNGIYQVFSSSRYTHALPQLSHQHLVATRETLRAGAVEADGYCWAIITKASDEVVGYISLLNTARNPRLVYLIHPDFWGRGYAPEACRAVLSYVFNELGYERVEQWIDVSNVASLRVAQKLGFRPLGRVQLRDENDHHYHATMIYGLEASEWRGETQARRNLSFVGIEPVLSVKDLGASVAFYCNLLGFRVEKETLDMAVRVARGDWSSQRIRIWLEQAPVGQPRPSRVRINVSGHLAALFDEYRAAGVEMACEWTGQSQDACEFAALDADGNTLIFASHS